MSKPLTGSIYIDSTTMLRSITTIKPIQTSQGHLLISLTGYQPGISIEMRANIDDLVMIAHRLLDIFEAHTRLVCERCDSENNVTMIDLGEHVCEACLTAVPETIDLGQQNSDAPSGYTLRDSETGESLRPATAWEATRSLLQADADGGYGFIVVEIDGTDRKVYAS